MSAPVQQFIEHAREVFALPITAQPVLPLAGLEDITEAQLAREELKAARAVILGLQQENGSLRDDLRRERDRNDELTQRLLRAQDHIHAIHERADTALYSILKD